MTIGTSVIMQVCVRTTLSPSPFAPFRLSPLTHSRTFIHRRSKEEVHHFSGWGYLHNSGSPEKLNWGLIQMGKSYPMHEQLNSLLGILSEDLKWEFLRGQLLTHRSVREASDNEPQHEGSDWASSITRYLNRYGRQLGKVVHEDALPKDRCERDSDADTAVLSVHKRQPGGTSTVLHGGGGRRGTSRAR